MKTITTADQIVALDLRAEAKVALAQGLRVLHDRRPYAYDAAINVETIVIEGMAGQAINADARWGVLDHDPAGEPRIEMDSGELVLLDGGEALSDAQMTKLAAEEMGDE